MLLLLLLLLLLITTTVSVAVTITNSLAITITITVADTIAVATDVFELCFFGSSHDLRATRAAKRCCGHLLAEGFEVGAEVLALQLGAVLKNLSFN